MNQALNSCPVYWPKAIILIDMNAFFASIEQLDHPEWRARPVAVTNGQRGSCIITCSYEARRYGVKTGMRLRQARKLCPMLLQCAARPRRYVEVSRNIMSALQQISPEVEVFSVDEAFLDVTACQRLLGTPVQIARLVKELVYDVSGLLCSVGVSGDKTTAKYAAKCDKPNGFCVIPPWQSRQVLAGVEVTQLCGIAEGIGNFLKSYGVTYCGEMAKLPISVLARRFGDPGRRIWSMCQGADPEALKLTVAAPKSIGHGKVMPPNTTEVEVILTYLLHMAEKVARRLRRHDLQAQYFFIGLRHYELGWIGGKYQLVSPSHDGLQIYGLAKNMLQACWQGEAVRQVQITALKPVPSGYQLDFFLSSDEKRARLNVAVDGINQRFGEFKLANARLLHRSDMPNVIAPAWKPDGHRQSIE
jgi:DNA polymerase IV